MRQLFELVGADRGAPYSPYVWRVRFCLAHKGLDFEGVPLKFLEKEPIAPADSKTVPVLRDGDVWVKDSFDIALYLDRTYPDKPLFGSAIAEAQARLINEYMTRTLLAGMFPMVTADICTVQDAENAVYYRETREKRLGRKLEDVQAGRDAQLPIFRQALAPVRAVLESQPFLGGDTPGWSDYALMGNFMWVRMVSSFEMLAEDDAVYAWRERMLDLFGGLGRSQKLAYTHAA